LAKLDAPRWGIQFFVKFAGIRFHPDLPFGATKVQHFFFIRSVILAINFVLPPSFLCAFLAYVPDALDHLSLTLDLFLDVRLRLVEGLAAMAK